MPYALVLTLQQTNDTPLTPGNGDLVNAAFFDLIARSDPKLAKDLHALADRKPFTLSLLKRRRIDADGPEISLRVTLLDDSLYPNLITSLLADPRADIRIGRTYFDIGSVLPHRAAHPLANASTYQDIVDSARPSEGVVLRFVTPTMFRSQRKDVLWPEPRLVWQSLVRAWNQNIDVRGLAFDEQEVVEGWASQVVVLRHRLLTRHMPLSSAGFEGVTGICRYGLEELNERARIALGLLADFAFYAGVGRKTTMGMGQTRRVLLRKGTPKVTMSDREPEALAANE